MKFEEITIPLAPRSTGDCLDLAVAFIRAYLRPFLAVWLAVALPACVVTYVMIDRFDGSMWIAILLLWFGSYPLGYLLISGAASAAFGGPFTLGQAFRHLKWKLLTRTLIGCLWRAVLLAALALPIVLGLMLPQLFFKFVVSLLGLAFAIPLTWYLLLRNGFSAEQSALAQLGGHLHDRRTDELIRGETGELFVRSFFVAGFSLLLWVVLLQTLDLVMTFLLGLPLLSGKGQAEAAYFENPSDQLPYYFDMLWSDPAICTAWLACGLLAYSLGRLAWFFCYLDVRVRRDCWDIELKILHEAERLESGT